MKNNKTMIKERATVGWLIYFRIRQFFSDIEQRICGWFLTRKYRRLSKMVEDTYLDAFKNDIGNVGENILNIAKDLPLVRLPEILPPDPVAEMKKSVNKTLTDLDKEATIHIQEMKLKGFSEDKIASEVYRFNKSDLDDDYLEHILERDSNDKLEKTA